MRLFTQTVKKNILMTYGARHRFGCMKKIEQGPWQEKEPFA
jgi:hypothetical protein